MGSLTSEDTYIFYTVSDLDTVIEHANSFFVFFIKHTSV